MDSKFVKSATELKHCPQDKLKEVVFLGRSNAGKSSIINSLLTRKGLAKVSGTPGKTRLMNFFLVNNSYRFVDLPGYGYAAVSNAEQEKWAKFIEEFLYYRKNLMGLVLVMDIRRKWSKDEQALYELSLDEGLPGILALTKADKLSKTNVSKAVKVIKSSCPVWDVMPVSSLKKTGVQEMHKYMYKIWKLGEKKEMSLDAEG